jgi:hypothetical protein
MLGGSGLLQRREERLRVLGELQQVGQPVHQPGQLAGDVDPLQQRLGDQQLVRVLVEQRRQQPAPRRVR